MSGSVMVARSLWDDPAFQNEPFSEREAWVWMIAEARWMEGEKRVGKVIVRLGRGQLAHSTRFLSECWKWSHSKVRRFLERLQNRNMIELSSDTGVTVISITKYDTYQKSPQPSGTEAKREAAQNRHSSGTNDNKGNKVNKEDTNVSSSARGARLPKDWELPEEWADWAAGQGMSILATEAEAARFKDYWIAASGANASKADWQATWRNWIRRAIENGRANVQPKKPEPKYGDTRRINGYPEKYDPSFGWFRDMATEDRERQEASQNGR